MAVSVETAANPQKVLFLVLLNEVFAKEASIGLAAGH
jgi:hypothetical protein